MDELIDLFESLWRDHANGEDVDTVALLQLGRIMCDHLKDIDNKQSKAYAEGRKDAREFLYEQGDLSSKGGTR